MNGYESTNMKTPRIKIKNSAENTNHTMTCSVFGNPDLAMDSLPIKLVKVLKKDFPSITFRVEDPNELDLPIQKHWMLLDTVKDLAQVQLLALSDISKNVMRVTAHDFDLATHLLLAKKIRKNLEVQIIGVPMHYDQEKALKEVRSILQKIAFGK